jgi:hypothetical protein
MVHILTLTQTLILMHQSMHVTLRTGELQAALSERMNYSLSILPTFSIRPVPADCPDSRGASTEVKDMPVRSWRSAERGRKAEKERRRTMRERKKSVRGKNCEGLKIRKRKRVVVGETRRESSRKCMTYIEISAVR